LFAFAYFNNSHNKPRAHSRGFSRIGHTADESAPSIRFTITNDRGYQALSDTPPFATDDGDWTVFECIPTDDPQAVMTVAVPMFAQRPNGAPAAFSKVVVWTSDRAVGDRVVKLFARAFHQPVPLAGAVQPLKPMKLGTAVLGEHVRRDGDAFVDSGNGTWTSTKWFLQGAGSEAEVFFNYDIVNHVGEFTQKDPQYDASLIALLAQGLRDGSLRR
jgi:hypothetical protein